MYVKVLLLVCNCRTFVKIFLNIFKTLNFYYAIILLDTCKYQEKDRYLQIQLFS
jgi:hypothetical protein